jgi:hypothetical protein
VDIVDDNDASRARSLNDDDLVVFRHYYVC